MLPYMLGFAMGLAVAVPLAILIHVVVNELKARKMIAMMRPQNSNLDAFILYGDPIRQPRYKAPVIAIFPEQPEQKSAS